LKIRGEIRGLLDEMALPLAIFRYGAKCECYTGHMNMGPVRHALSTMVRTMVRIRTDHDRDGRAYIYTLRPLLNRRTRSQGKRTQRKSPANQFINRERSRVGEIDQWRRSGTRRGGSALVRSSERQGFLLSTGPCRTPPPAARYASPSSPSLT
jgi:hypothetical protein